MFPHLWHRLMRPVLEDWKRQPATGEAIAEGFSAIVQAPLGNEAGTILQLCTYAELLQPAGQFVLGHQPESGNDDQIAQRGTAGGRAVQRDAAAAALAPDRIGDEALAIGDIPDVHLLVLQQVGGVTQVFMDRARSLAVQVARGNGGAVDRGLGMWRNMAVPQQVRMPSVPSSRWSASQSGLPVVSSLSP